MGGRRGVTLFFHSLFIWGFSLLTLLDQVHFSYAQRVSIGFRLAGKDLWGSFLLSTDKVGREKVVPLNLSSLGRRDWGMMPAGWKLPIADQGIIKCVLLVYSFSFWTFSKERGRVWERIQGLGLFYLRGLLGCLGCDHNGRENLLWVHVSSMVMWRGQGNPEHTLKMLDKDCLNRPVLKHGPRSLTYVRVLWWDKTMMHNESEFHSWSGLGGKTGNPCQWVLNAPSTDQESFLSSCLKGRKIRVRAYPLGPERWWTMPA